ncbi:hypothetical protein TSUD_43280 [Trifolium subterraneum]|uniref:Uncharacterized protein n=1 Tax=Trifolium subterraneum TaxID=3900 RepID=A0A2Z6NZW1_TRISU|nr:hypothetical protein TSUD_43280 [Trifolium subterraneum]
MIKKSDKRQEKPQEVPESSIDAGARTHPGRSFKAAVIDEGRVQLIEEGGVRHKEVEQNSKAVVWEVEVETEALARLKGAFVGSLAVYKEAHDIQQNFVMDGYHNIRVAPLGHLRVLLSSSVEGEVRDVVKTVGWWCTYFDRFEEWSPETISNQRAVWLKCYGVPLHAWGNALFRSLAFKFGSFIEVDDATKSMNRGDYARIRIATKKLSLIDSTMNVSVLGKRFEIRVLEEVGTVEGDDGGINRCVCCAQQEQVSSRGSVDGGSIMAMVEGSVDGGSDGDWSVSGRVMLGVGRQEVRKRRDNGTRLDMVQVGGESDVDPNFLGKSLGLEESKVNSPLVEVLAVDERVLGESGKSNKSAAGLESVPSRSSLLGEVAVGEGMMVGSVNGVRREELGLICVRPNILRTKERDIPFSGPIIGGPSVQVSAETQRQQCASARDVSSFAGRCRKGKNKKKQTQNPLHLGNTFLKFQNQIHRKGGAVKKKKVIKGGERKKRYCSSGDSDPIQGSTGENDNSMTSNLRQGNTDGINLEVVLPIHGDVWVDQSSGDVPCSLEPRRRGLGSGVVDLVGSGSVNGGGSQSIGGTNMDREVVEAHLIIDILDDLGMDFKGDGDEDARSAGGGFDLFSRPFCESLLEASYS